MEISCYIFSKISNYYVLIHDDKNGLFSTSKILEKKILFNAEAFKAILNDKKLININELVLLNDNFKPSSGNYNVIVHNGFISLKRKKLFDFTNKKVIINYCSSCSNQFKYSLEKETLSSLLENNPDQEECIKSFKDYLFCDDYSFWRYNKITETFILENTSFEPGVTVITKAAGTSLNSCIDHKYTFESRPIKGNKFTSNLDKEIKHIKRIKINLDISGGDFAILTFFTKYSDFKLSNKIAKKAKHYFQNRFSVDYRDNTYNLLKYLENLSYIYEFGNLDSVLKDLPNQIANNFGFEACSYFKIEGDKAYLFSTKTRDRFGLHDEEPIIYDCNVPSLTTMIYHQVKPIWSYDVSLDERNTHIYDEETHSKPRNWLGYPVVVDKKVVGIIRAKNKYNDYIGNLAHINELDFYNLREISTRISSLISLEWYYENTQRRLMKSNKKYDDLNSFNRVVLHEIRTPISKFTMSPTIIIRNLTNKTKGIVDITPEIRRLEDIKVMGGRLKFIVNTYNLFELIDTYKPKKCFLLNDVVLPVTNIIEPYAEKQHSFEVITNKSTMSSIAINGDAQLLSIAFNSLVDNAVKYTMDAQNPIKIYGEKHSSGKFYELFISNNGIGVSKKERNFIFDENTRGSNAKEHHITGTGVGLYLTSEIMKKHGGEIILTSTHKPTTFCLRIPLYEF